MSMKAVWFEQAGAAQKVLKYGERDKPVVGDGQVMVRLHASAVNPSDVKKRAGAQPPEFVDGFVIPHSDGAGIIESVGPGVDEHRIGERVWVYQAQFGRHMGTCAQFVVLPSALAARLPDNTGFDIGACAGVPMMTAHRCVSVHGDIAGKTLLITGASGRVGYYAAQLAVQASARVIATAGSDARCEIARQTGAHDVLNYRSDGLAESILELTNGKGIDGIVDVEFGINAETSAVVLKNNGSISTYSSSQAPQPAIPFYPMMFKNITLYMVLVYNMPNAAKEMAIAEINSALANDTLRHRIAETWSLENTARAHESIEDGGLDGCVVIEIDQ